MSSARKKWACLPGGKVVLKKIVLGRSGVKGNVHQMLIIAPAIGAKEGEFLRVPGWVLQIYEPDTVFLSISFQADIINQIAFVGAKGGAAGAGTNVGAPKGSIPLALNVCQ